LYCAYSGVAGQSFDPVLIGMQLALHAALKLRRQLRVLGVTKRTKKKVR